MKEGFERIGDYYIIGDLHTSALVSKNASIDWLCFPHFHSPSIFSRMLDEKGGCFSVMGERHEYTVEYSGETAIVKFEFKKQGHKFELLDFMVPQKKNVCDAHFLVRKLKGITGKGKVKFYLSAKPGYAKRDAKFNVDGSGNKLKIGEHIMFLHLPNGAKLENSARGQAFEIEISKGEEKEIVLEYAVKKHSCTMPRDLEGHTRKYWEKWISQGKFINFCRKKMARSAITLKLMQFYPTGALIAAPTTSLPEDIGGVRNWDYRYMWVRDATFALYAFYIMGFEEELEKFFSFVEKIAGGCPQCGGKLHLMYTINGKHVPGEEMLENLSGYRDSSPVRKGNLAFSQFQLDVYGTLIDAYYFMWKNRGMLSEGAKENIISLAEDILLNWKKKDQGIWEVREEKRHYTYSKVMCWVGIDRAIRMAGELGVEEKKLGEWKKAGKEIREWTWENCYSEELGSFVQYPGSSHQDATNLLFIPLQFLDRHDEKSRKVIENTCKELAHKDIFVYRYLSDDGLEGGEGAFLLCTFWLIASLAAVGRRKKAMRIYRELEKRISKSMLMSEEIDSETGDYLGNFPQAFSHMGLIFAAYYIERYSGGVEK